MHTFTQIDAQILLGLSYADKGVEISCAELVEGCKMENLSVPALPEFAEAFNKFLYVSAISLNGDKIILGDFGRDIINKARSKSSANVQADELVMRVLKELASYKLKSMCNRTVWNQAQYQQATNTNLDTHKL